VTETTERDDPRPQLARLLDLAQHPEGGWYRRTYTSGVPVEAPPGGSGVRPAVTLIHYLLLPGERSAWHTVASDEIWLWHRGGPLRLWCAGTGAAPDNADVTSHLLGPAVEDGQRLQTLVPAGTWQSAEPATQEEVLVSCLVSPGFDFADFRLLDLDAERS